MCEFLCLVYEVATVQSSLTFGLVVDPFIDFICCPLWVTKVQAHALTLVVGFVGGYKGLLHGETLFAEHGIGNHHNVLVGLGCQGLVQLL